MYSSTGASAVYSQIQISKPEQFITQTRIKKNLLIYTRTPLNQQSFRTASQAELLEPCTSYSNIHSRKLQNYMVYENNYFSNRNLRDAFKKEELTPM